MKPDNYIVIQGWMCNDLQLRGNELLVFALIHGFSQDGESRFSGSRKYIADTLNISLPTVDTCIKNLIKKQLIEKHRIDKNGVVFNYYNSLPTVKKFGLPGKEILPNKYNNKLFISKDINNSTKIIPEIRTFVDLYNEYCTSLPKCVRITEKRRSAINNLLKKYTRDDIIKVFKNIQNSDFLKGNNDRGWKANIDFILREDKFLKILEGGYQSFNTAQSRIEKTGVDHVSAMSEQDYKELDSFVEDLKANGLQSQF